MEAKSQIIVIVGPTASGKTTAAIKCAQRWGGEIICADSRTIYRGMDIGTAKPTLIEQRAVSHFGLNVVDPGEKYTVVDFKLYAEQRISEIQARGNVPVIVGGTGLYIDSLLYDYDFPAEPTQVQKQYFERMQTDELYKYCINNNIELPENDKNKRHLIRSIYQKGLSPRRNYTLASEYKVVGIATNNIILKQRIHKRSEQIFANNVVDEAIRLGKKYGWKNEAMTGNVYRIIKKYLDGEISINQAIEKNTIADRQLAKRQMTWFRRNPNIQWCKTEDIENFLSVR